MIFNYDVSDVYALLGNIDFANAQEISTADEHLDNYTNGGIWYFSSSYTPINKPSDAGNFGFLIVINGSSNSPARLVQIWIDTARTANRMWMRSNSATTVNWGDWKRISFGDMTSKTITPTVVSTLPDGITAINNVTVVQSGNVVTVSLAVTRDDTAISTYTTIASGLPIPKVRPMSGTSTIPFGQINVASATQGWPLNVAVNASGNLNVIRGTVAGNYMGTFTYITDEI